MDNLNCFILEGPSTITVISFRVQLAILKDSLVVHVVVIIIMIIIMFSFFVFFFIE